MLAIGKSLLMMRRPTIDLVVNATISKRSSGVAGSRTSRSDRQGDRCGIAAEHHQQYQPSHRDFGRDAGHHRKILDRTCRCLDARTFTGQRRALRLQADQRCGRRLPLRIQPIPRHTLLCRDVDGPRHPAKPCRFVHGPVDLRNAAVEVGNRQPIAP